MSLRLGAIQRRCGERTEDRYLVSLTSFDYLETTRGRDLFDAAANSLRIACEIAAEWTIFADADMRLYPGARDAIKAVVCEAADDVYQLRFLCDDKILARPIYGLHVHRNALAPPALAWFEGRGERCLKAESRNIKRFMREHHLRTVSSDLVVASHDFGQYFRDVFRKHVIRGLRSPRRIEAMLDALRDRIDDPDVRAAMEGLSRARYLGSVVDASREVVSADGFYTATGLVERAPMSEDCEDDDRGGLRSTPTGQAP